MRLEHAVVLYNALTSHRWSRFSDTAGPNKSLIPSTPFNTPVTPLLAMVIATTEFAAALAAATAAAMFLEPLLSFLSAFRYNNTSIGRAKWQH